MSFPARTCNFSGMPAKHKPGLVTIPRVRHSACTTFPLQGGKIQPQTDTLSDSNSRLQTGLPVSLPIVSFKADTAMPGILKNSFLCCITTASQLAAFLGTLFSTAAYAAATDELIQFNRDIRPILAANCLECHGFDARTRKAELRLDTAAGALREHNGRAAITPGKPETSELIHRIESSDADIQMPPPETGKTLTSQQKQMLRRWVEQGATWQKHWAFEVPVKPTFPAPGKTDWVRNPVDAFILNRLEQIGLQPQPEADRTVLIRRVAFVLTGLPPAVTDVDEYLADQSPDAYQKMLERYLQSPRYGEEQARHWLDVARYADTHGLHLDNEREMWAWRDWVISAYNQNLPFDQFTTWQLAGDLLPNATLEQKVATGFNRCNVTTSEGGAINEEWLYRYAVDRTSTAMQTWMGLTAGCAVCHDHKYDPITTRDFYSMYAFFYSAADPGMDGNISRTQPFLRVPDPEKQQLTEAAGKQVRMAEELLLEALNNAAASGNLADEPADPAAERMVSDIILDDQLPPGSRSRNTSRNDAVWVRSAKAGDHTDARSLELAYGSEYDLTIDLTLIPIIVPAEGVLTVDVWTDPRHPPRSLRIQYDDGRSRRSVWTSNTEVSGGTRMGGLPAPGSWHSLEIPLQQAGSATGARIKSIVLGQDGGRVRVDCVRISGRTVAARDPRTSFNTWWQLSKGTSPDGIPAELQKLLIAGPQDNADPDKLQQLKLFWRKVVQRIEESPAAAQRKALDSALARQAAILDDVPGTFMFTDLPQPREAFVMERGQYDKRGAKVEPGVPAEFPPLRNTDGNPLTGRRASRLDLASWFTSPENPLTARVTVNRIWQQVFGAGLVRTSDDFGTRGDPPSHPELLDWLATEFRDSGWDQKQFFRLLLTSAAFRQAAVATESSLQLDPDNRLLSRGPRLRLDAEQLRDNVLFVSGLLDTTMGGRGAMPYQPPDIWEPVGYENSNTRFYMQEHGSALYRRSIYCFVKRTAPPPFMTNFDAPNREQFCSRRERSNTPLQALQLMNDVQHFEAARVLAQRLLQSPGDDAARISLLLRTVLARGPAEEELQILRQALHTQRQHYLSHPEKAELLIRNGEAAVAEQLPAIELAAWTMLCNLVLNLDETVCRN